MSEFVPLSHADLSRRALLRGGVVAVGSMLGAAALVDGRAVASVPRSQFFDLTQPSYDLFRGKSLRGGRVMQSLTFDNANRRLFVAQVMDGSEAEHNGDLYINQLDFAGNLLGSMTLLGFGHGVSIGVEPVGSASYLWTEVDSVNARGTRIARFPYANRTTLRHDEPSLRKFTPVRGDIMTCAVDPINERLAVRHRAGGTFRITVFDLAAAATGDFAHPLADVAQPTDLGTFQGYTIYGEYLYLLEGDAYGNTNPPPSDCGSATIAGNSRITSVDLNTGQVQQHRVPTKAACTLSYREPEGMAIYRTVGGETRLFFGFASGGSGARRCNVLYKNALKNS